MEITSDVAFSDCKKTVTYFVLVRCLPQTNVVNLNVILLCINVQHYWSAQKPWRYCLSRLCWLQHFHCRGNKTGSLICLSAAAKGMCTW